MISESVFISVHQWFNRLAAKYFVGNSIDKIAADDRLVIHFSYGSWNGEGWFRKFAAALNGAKGTKQQIFQTAIKARTEAPSKALLDRQPTNRND